LSVKLFYPHADTSARYFPDSDRVCSRITAATAASTSAGHELTDSLRPSGRSTGDRPIPSARRILKHKKAHECGLYSTVRPEPEQEGNQGFPSCSCLPQVGPGAIFSFSAFASCPREQNHCPATQAAKYRNQGIPGKSFLPARPGQRFSRRRHTKSKVIRPNFCRGTAAHPSYTPGRAAGIAREEPCSR
jgi:hypothetical protein